MRGEPISKSHPPMLPEVELKRDLGGGAKVPNLALPLRIRGTVKHEAVVDATS